MLQSYDLRMVTALARLANHEHCSTVFIPLEKSLDVITERNGGGA